VGGSTFTDVVGKPGSDSKKELFGLDEFFKNY